MTRRRLPTKRSLIRIKSKVGNYRVYVDMGKYEDGSLGEVFVTVAKVGSTFRGLLDSWSRMLSGALQYGMPLWKVISMARGAEFEPMGDVYECDGVKTCTSLPDFVAQVIQQEYPEESKRPKDSYVSLYPSKRQI